MTLHHHRHCRLNNWSLTHYHHHYSLHIFRAALLHPQTIPRHHHRPTLHLPMPTHVQAASALIRPSINYPNVWSLFRLLDLLVLRRIRISLGRSWCLAKYLWWYQQHQLSCPYTANPGLCLEQYCYVWIQSHESLDLFEPSRVPKGGMGK